ncbi:MAG: serine/threonine protein kinase, partial [Planctomycetes bacterium]|nr:serine/threonine protein kinase [Planctomycetota bacterium]
MADEHERIEAVFEELVELVLRGEAPDLEGLFARHPELSAAERERLAVRARIFAGASDAERLPFERLGDFQLLRRLGAGGMGVVYLARQESLRRLTALKLMRPELAGDATAARRFEREARAVAQLQHPGIVGVYAAGEEQGVRFLALEYLEGQSLDELLRAEGPRLEPTRVVRWGRELAEALSSAHAQGVVHRDVKPSNVRIGLDGRARLLDFGLAQLADASALSASGSFRGTPYYASPEQVDPRGKTIDARTDVYSLGATLYQCLTGQPPFEGASSAEVFHGILTREPLRPRVLAPAISRDLETVLLKALEKDPARRYASAEAFARDLAALLEMRPIAARPPGSFTRVVKWTRRNRGTSAAAGVALVLGLAFLGLLIGQRMQARRRFEAELARAAATRATDESEEGLRAVERALALRPEDGRALALRAQLVRDAAKTHARESLDRARADS